MKNSPLLISSLLASVGALLSATPLAAQTFAFSGNRENVNPITPPGGRCVPPYFNTINIAPGALSSTGTSNLGPFTSTQSHCITSAPPTDVVEGRFTYTFRAGDTITGTYTGRVSNSATPGVFDAIENLVVTGGTGRFTGATGAIASNGTLRFGEGPTGIFAGTVNGSLNATATVTGNFGTALGQPSAATGDYSTAVGAFSIAAGQRSLSAGSFAEATAAGAVALGDATLASGPAALAAGQGATATGEFSTAVGNLAQATNVRTTAVGRSALANGLNATAVGNASQATGMGASAFGNGAVATQMGTLATGVRSTASGVNGTAVGALATASGTRSTAVGAGTSATFEGSTAIGAGATTTAVNQVSLGGAGSSVRIGDVGASTAAQTGTVSVATVDANGTLGRNTSLIPAVAALQTSSATQAGQISALEVAGAAQAGRLSLLEAAGAALSGRVDSLFDLRQLDRRDMRQGIAAAVAMGHAAMPSAPGVTSFVVNGALFRGEAAVGGSILHRLGGEKPIAIGAGFSFAGNKNNAVRVGLAGEF